MAKLSVSVFAADIMHVEEDLNAMEEMDIDSLHIDVMDGHFVPLFGYNQVWIEEIAERINKDMEIHMMVYLNKEILNRFIQLDPSEISFHIEAHTAEQNMNYIKMIKAAGIKCGLAVSPDTPCAKVEDYLEEIDSVLLMTAYPGCEASAFLDTSYSRVEEMKKMIEQSGRDVVIGVDGALNRARAKEIIKRGADKIVVGRAFYNDVDRVEFIHNVHKLQSGKS